MIPTHYITSVRQGGDPVYTAPRLVQVDFTDPRERASAAGAEVLALLYDDDVQADYRHLDRIALVLLADGTPLGGTLEVAVYGVNLVTRQGGGIPQTICELIGGWS